MSRVLSLTSRRAGRWLSGAGAAVALGMAVHTTISMTDPVLRLFDGWWMLGGTALAVAIVGPLARRWSRERAVLAVVTAAALGAWLPLVGLAFRSGIPVSARLKGAIFFSSADVIGVTLPVGVALAWLALQEYSPKATDST